MNRIYIPLAILQIHIRENSNFLSKQNRNGYFSHAQAGHTDLSRRALSLRSTYLQWTKKLRARFSFTIPPLTRSLSLFHFVDVLKLTYNLSTHMEILTTHHRYSIFFLLFFVVAILHTERENEKGIVSSSILISHMMTIQKIYELSMSIICVVFVCIDWPSLHILIFFLSSSAWAGF